MENGHVLVVDDDSLIGFLVEQSLKSTDLQVTVVSSGEAALRLLSAVEVDAIIVDVVMPGGMDGFELCSTIRKKNRYQSSPILIMASSDDVESITRAYEAGATDFITKPLNFPLLGHRLRYMLRYSETTKNLIDSERRLHRMAYFDDLTGLYNRLSFRENLEIMTAHAQREQHHLAVLFLDIDDFKRINDTLGHHFGDLMLQEISLRLRKILRHSDIMMRSNYSKYGDISLARLGGDEFTVLLSKIDAAENSAHVAERIRSALAEPLILQDQELFVTTSIGISVFPADGNGASELIKNADMAMYQAKRDGGNTYRYYSNQMSDHAVRRLQMEKLLHKALANNEFEVHYQPQFDLVSERICGAEALLRWHNPTFGLISPSEFIPLAEEIGVIVELGEWVLRKACLQATNWHAQGMPLRIAINVSARQLRYKNFSSQLEAIITECAINPGFLELEFTESALISEESHVQNILISLKKIGVLLAIDDFGIGYSSLNRLKNLPIDRLKIDKSFVIDSEHDKTNLAIVTAVIAIANSLDMQVIAEGVETSEQFRFIKDRGCREIQGHYICEPKSAEEIQEFLANQFVSNKPVSNDLS